MKPKKQLYYVLLFVAVLSLNVLSLFLFRKHAQITKYSIPAICLLAFHLLYGLLAYLFRHKGNFLRLKRIFIRHFKFYFFEPDKEYTFTKEYKQHFNQMLAIYCFVLPFYIPCIFFTSTAVAMPFALLIFLFPQIIFVSKEIRGFANDINDAKQKKQQLEEELKEQERREEMGRSK